MIICVISGEVAQTSLNTTLISPPQPCLKAEAVAEGISTSSGMSREQRPEDEFERWAGEAGIKAPKLRHEVFTDALVGDLR